MTAIRVSGSGFRARAGTLTLLFVASDREREALLAMLADALSGGALRDDEDPEPEIQIDDDGLFDSDPVFDPLAEADLPIDPDAPMGLTPVGQQMLFAGLSLERWLRKSPHGPLRLGTLAAGRAAAALVCGWSATVIHALAREPLTLPQLNEAVEILSYGTLEEHVDAMEAAGQVEALDDGEGETRYAVTDWLREGIAPLAAAARLERHQSADDTAPPESLDIEAAFQLVLPLLELPANLSGGCRLGVELPDREAPHLAGATAQVENGRVSVSAHLDHQTGTWASGSARDWLDTVIEPATQRLETGGDGRLAAALLDGLHRTLFGIPGQ